MKFSRQCVLALFTLPAASALGFVSVVSDTSSGPGSFRCGAVLVSEDIVLTSSTCVRTERFGHEKMWVRIGVSDDETSIATRQVETYAVHPYAGTGTGGVEKENIPNDLAVIKLSEPVDSTLATPIDLNDDSAVPGDNGVTVIYGHAGALSDTGFIYGAPYFEGNFAETLQTGSTETALFKQCRQDYKYLNQFYTSLLQEDKQFCVDSTETQGPCDTAASGSPLWYSTGEGPPILVGVGSQGSCSSDKPPYVYTRVSYYKDWIVMMICSLSDVASCDEYEHTIFGNSLSMGNGRMKTFGTIKDDSLTKVGVKFDASSLDGLPTAPSDGRWDIRNAEGATVIPLGGHEHELFFPAELNSFGQPFKHFVANWNPFGHGPPGIYNVPHIDFHFYLISSYLRNNCVPSPLIDDICPTVDDPGFAFVDCDSLAFLMEPLPEDQMPSGFVRVTGAAEPGMGNHLIPVTSVEFNGVAFTHTWIYGFQGGKLSFWEPMITIEYLEWLKAIVVDGISDPVDPNGGRIVLRDGAVSVWVDNILPRAAPAAGMYPTKYYMAYELETDEFTVGLTGFAYFPRSSLVKNLPCPSG